MERALRSGTPKDGAIRGNVRIIKKRETRGTRTKIKLEDVDGINNILKDKYIMKEEAQEDDEKIVKGIKSESSDDFKSIKVEAPLYEPFPTNPLQVFKKKDDSPANIFQRALEDNPDSIEASTGGLGPKNWTEIYNKVVEMRSKFISPVDTMGCERIPEQIDPTIRYSNPVAFRFQLLISLMLSSQTKDEVNYEAVLRMNHYFIEKGYTSLCLEAVLETLESVIDSLIQKVGFHNRKSTYMKKSCELLKQNFDGDIPKTITEIVTLPGVGPKMGYLLLYKAWDISDGIGVDVHLHRLATMWNWAPKTNNPETTRVALEKWLPRRYWADINPLLVGFGQMICLPRGSKCDLCSLATSGLCKSVNRKVLKLRGDPKRMIEVRKGRGDISMLLDEIKKEQPLHDIEDLQ